MSHLLRRKDIPVTIALAAACVFLAGPVGGEPKAKPLPGVDDPQPRYKSPTWIAFSPDGKRAYVTCHTADSLCVIDAAGGKVVAEVPVGRRPTGVAAGRNGKLVFVANTRDHTVSFVDAAARKPVATVRCGYEPMGLAVSPDGKRVYTANFVSDDVSVLDVAARKEVRRIPVGRAPTFLALTPDGRRLLVNNSMSRQPATDPKLTAHVSVIDPAAGKVVAEKRSPGAMLLNMGIAVSGDGRYAFSVHSRANFNVTPSQLNQGWVHTNALSIIPLAPPPAKAKAKAKPKAKKPPAKGAKPPKAAAQPTVDEALGEVFTVLLDNVSSGAANPHGLAVAPDGRRLYVGHRGTHQVSIVDLPKLRRLIGRTPPERRVTAHVNLGFLWETGEIVRRVSSGGLGPHGLAVCPADGSVWVTNYFSNNVAVLDGATGRLRRRIALGGPDKMTLVRRGEFLFHDAGHCFQQWVSCTSCHPFVRSDGVNWDLLNDGQTNPKNAKSLIGAWQTPPAMAMGVRASMEVAAEKGFVFIQFVQPRREELAAVEAFLRSVKHVPSPFHRGPGGKLDAAAQRGRKVFAKAGCDGCHPAPLYTDLESYDVGTRPKRELARNKDREFDTPSLLEIYRTGPYLHDGRAATLEEVLTRFNPNDEHGRTRKLSKQELADLAAFLKSL